MSLLQAIAALISALVWPVLLLFLVLRFSKPILSLLQDEKSAETNVKATFAGVGVELGIKRKLDAVAALTAATVTREGTEGQPANVGQDKLNDIVETVEQAGTVGTNSQGGRRTVLWVDDAPSNNYFEQETLRALGIKTVTSLSTDNALSLLKTNHFDLVISDFSRPDDPQAGYTLLAHLRQLGYDTPYIIYSSSNRSDYRKAAIERSAYGTTNDPQELVSLVLSALKQSSSAIQPKGLYQ